MTTDLNVIPDDDGWAIEAVGDGKRTIFSTQQKAIKVGNERARLDKVELWIYGRDRELRVRNSFRPRRATS